MGTALGSHRLKNKVKVRNKNGKPKEKEKEEDPNSVLNVLKRGFMPKAERIKADDEADRKEREMKEREMKKRRAK